MIFSTRQFQFRRELLALMVIEYCVPAALAGSLAIETPVSLENTRTWNSIGFLWNDSHGTVFVKTNSGTTVLDAGIQLPLTFPIATDANGRFIAHAASN